jgi:hypothetical protein
VEVLRDLEGRKLAAGRRRSNPRPGQLPSVNALGSRAEKRNAVEERNVLPGRRIVLGKAGWFGESGKCCVSSATPAYAG